MGNPKLNIQISKFKVVSNYSKRPGYAFQPFVF